MQQSLVASRQKVPQDAGRVCGRESTRCLLYVLAIHYPWEASVPASCCVHVPHTLQFLDGSFPDRFRTHMSFGLGFRFWTVEPLDQCNSKL